MEMGKRRSRRRQRRRRVAPKQGARCRKLPEEVTRRLGEANLLYATSRCHPALHDMSAALQANKTALLKAALAVAQI
jgi:hypothetical protein